MGNLKKRFVLMTTLGLFGAGAMSAHSAKASTASDDLYSESIYIHKSAAEVPQALDSNASPQADRNIKVSANKPIESLEDIDHTAATKKITQREGNDSALDN